MNRRNNCNGKGECQNESTIHFAAFPIANACNFRQYPMTEARSRLKGAPRARSPGGGGRGQGREGGRESATQGTKRPTAAVAAVIFQLPFLRQRLVQNSQFISLWQHARLPSSRYYTTSLQVTLGSDWLHQLRSSGSPRLSPLPGNNLTPWDFRPSTILDGEVRGI